MDTSKKEELKQAILKRLEAKATFKKLISEGVNAQDAAIKAGIKLANVYL